MLESSPADMRLLHRIVKNAVKEPFVYFQEVCLRMRDELGTVEMSDDLGTILKRIDRRLKAVKLTDRAASLAAGLSADGIRSLRRQHKEGTQKSVRLITLTALAGPLKTTSAWLSQGLGNESLTFHGGGTLEPEPPVNTIKIRGEVAAGAWIEPESDVSSPLFTFPIPPDPRFPIEQQYGLTVRGTSINKVANEGDVLICLDLSMSRADVRDNDLVIVEQRRKGNPAREITAKRLRWHDGIAELAFESTEARYTDEKTPGYVAPTRVTLQRTKSGVYEGTSSGNAITVVARVVSAYRPMSYTR
jgi:SOS-response transcriptional repressor LexA